MTPRPAQALPGTILLGCLGAVLTSGGCLPKTVQPFDPGATGRIARSADSRALFRPAQRLLSAPAIEVRTLRTLDGYEITDFDFPSVGENRQPENRVAASYYRAESPGKRGLVLILPIWGSATFPSNALRRELQARALDPGVDVLMVHGKHYLFDWDGIALASSPAILERRIGRSVQAVQNTVQDLRRLVTWALDQNDVDPGRLAIVGFSFSALAGAMTVGLDDRLETGVFIMGGGDLHEIFASCSSFAGKTRRAVQRTLGWSADELARRTRDVLAPINPNHYVREVDPAGILLVNASRDFCIPEPARDGFWHALGRPERILIQAGHRHAFFTMTPLGRHWTTRRVADFLTARLAGPGSGQEPDRPGDVVRVGGPG